MSDRAENATPPYCTFGSFISFINSLRDTNIPAKIDNTVFGAKSGGTIYSILAALKSLKMIDKNNAPTERLRLFVAASDDDRKPMMREILKDTYPTLFGDALDLKTASAGQFNEALREDYQISGSTIDKVAAFFLAAAKAAEIDLSHHLKNRKAIATSSSSRKSPKQRKNVEGDKSTEDANVNRGDTNTNIPSKPLQYQLIDLMSEPDFPDGIKSAIWELVQYLTARAAKKSATPTSDVADQ